MDATPKTKRPPVAFSPREVEIIRFLARGKAHKEIGPLLETKISEATVKSHIARCTDKACDAGYKIRASWQLVLLLPNFQALAEKLANEMFAEGQAEFCKTG